MGWGGVGGGGLINYVLGMKSSLMDISFFVCPVSKTALKYRCQDYGMKYTAKIKQNSNQKKFHWGLHFKHIAQTLISLFSVINFGF